MLLLSAGLFGCENSTRSDQRVETLELSSGRRIVDHAYTEHSWDGAYEHNQLSFQSNSTARPEFIEDVWYLGTEPLFSRYGDDHFAEQSNHIVVTVGPYVFKRVDLRGGPVWVHEQDPDTTARFFLSTFLPPNSHLTKTSPAAWQAELNERIPFYAVCSIDLTNNVLITERTETNHVFPRFLIYSGAKCGLPWKFDLERTRTANHLTGPTNSNLAVQVSVIKIRAHLESVHVADRQAVLQLPTAKEVWNQTLPLSGQHWTKVRFPSQTADTSHTDEEYKVILGFIGPSGRYCMFWRGEPVLGDALHACRPGEWAWVDASGFTNGCRIVYIRVIGKKTPNASAP